MVSRAVATRGWRAGSRGSRRAKHEEDQEVDVRIAHLAVLAAQECLDVVEPSLGGDADHPAVDHGVRVPRAWVAGNRDWVLEAPVDERRLRAQPFDQADVADITNCRARGVALHRQLEAQNLRQPRRLDEVRVRRHRSLHPADLRVGGADQFRELVLRQTEAEPCVANGVTEFRADALAPALTHGEESLFVGHVAHHPHDPLLRTYCRCG